MAASLCLLAAYFVIWRTAVQQRPLDTMRGTMRHARREWVKAHLGKGMLPVNTLRDIIKSSQWFASSALLVAVGACGFLASTDSTVVNNDMLKIKTFCLIATCSLTFIFFMHATRYYSHVSFLINTPEIAGVPMSEELVSRVVDKASDMWSRGMKCQTCVGLPVLLWVFGPLYLVLGTALVIVITRQLDFDNIFEDDASGSALIRPEAPRSTTAQAAALPLSREEHTELATRAL